MVSLRNKTPDWPFDVDKVCRALKLRFKGPWVTIDVMAQTIQALGYPAVGIRRNAIGTMFKPAAEKEPKQVLYVKEQSHYALVLGDLVLDSRLGRSWDAVLLEAHRGLMPEKIGFDQEWETQWMVTGESTTEDLDDRSPALVAAALKLAKQHLTPGWSMQQTVAPAPVMTHGFPVVKEGPSAGDLDIADILLRAFEKAPGLWKASQELKEVIMQMHSKGLEAEGFVRTTETQQVNCPNTARVDYCLLLHFAGHQAKASNGRILDVMRYRTPGSPLQLQQLGLEKLKTNKNNPGKPAGGELPRRLVQLHLATLLTTILPPAEPDRRKPRM